MLGGKELIGKFPGKKKPIITTSFLMKKPLAMSTA
jgi:hypothetical protein